MPLDAYSTSSGEEIPRRKTRRFTVPEYIRYNTLSR